MLKRIFCTLIVIAVVVQSFPMALAARIFETETIVEAEDASLKSTMLICNSPYSIGGKHVTTRATTISKTSNIVTDDISWLFDIKLSGRFYGFARVFFSSASANSFYYRWDDGEWQLYQGKMGKDYEWVKLEASNLTLGTHKLQISHKQANVWFDAAIITENQDFVPETPEGIGAMPEPERVVVERTYTQEQKTQFTVFEPGMVVEADELKLASGMGTTKSEGASGGKAVFCGPLNPAKETPEQGSGGAVELTFTAGETATYFVWSRMLATRGGGYDDSVFFAVDDGAYGYHMLSVSDSYNWKRWRAIKMEKGETKTIKFYPRANNWYIDQIVVTTVNYYVPRGAVEEVSLERKPLKVMAGYPPVNPPQEHPRVLFRSSDIDKIKKNIEAEENIYSKSRLLAVAKKDINLGTAFNDTTLSEIKSKAFYYAIYGDKEVGRQAIELSIGTGDWDYSGSTAISRWYGQAVYTMSCVYDWCYDLLTEDEKTTMIQICTSQLSAMEMGWPPNFQSIIVSHTSEALILRDSLSFAIAVYNECPDVWDCIGGGFYNRFVPARQWEVKANIHHQGGNYGEYRHNYTALAYLLITGMGLEEPWSGQDTANFGYSRAIYLRRPDGNIFLEGDMYNSTPMTYAGTDSLFNNFAISKDPYLKDAYLKDSAGKADISGVTSGGSNPERFIFYDTDVERKSISNLPLSRYFGSPMGVMAARTGWEDGVNSDTVVAYMNVGEYYFGNHQHKDAGNFQIYYKGPLATESGIYQNGEPYGGYSWTRYTYNTIAHNSILVYDPNEPLINFWNGVNDGGQRQPLGTGAGTSGTIEDFKNMEGTNRATVMAHEIDPSDTTEPDYTYLKGDITNAYTDKVSDFKRSFMFLNFKDEKIPAAMIVFDKVSSSNPSFKKTWLLHGQTKPEYKGTRTIWGSNPYVDDLGYEYTGKMVVDSLLPVKENISMTTVGGPEDGWCIVNGVNYEHPEKRETFEENTYRLEVSPKKAAETDYFLNCIQVTDRDNTDYLDVQVIDDTLFYGVKISDRAVLFSKSGQKISDDFEINTGDDRTFDYTVCDIEKGTWSVIAGGQEQTVTVTEDGGVLAFTANDEKITVRRQNEDVIQSEYVQELKDEQDIYIKCDGRLVEQPVKAEIKNGKLIAPLSDLAKKMEITVDRNFITTILKDDAQKIDVRLKQNSDVLVKNNENILMENAVYEQDGELMVELRTLAESFNYVVHWDNVNKMVYLIADKQIVVERAEGYAEVVKITGDGRDQDPEFLPEYINDYIVDTLWSSLGTDRYIDFELNEDTILENVEIIFNPNKKRTAYFEILVSNDGENFTSVYDGIGSPDGDGVNWEVFEFDIRKLVQCKYVRYIAKGSNISDWNGVKEIRFKIGKEMVTWDNTEEHAVISRVIPDSGEISGNYISTNLVDGNSRTCWEALGRNRYVDFKFETDEEISGVEVVFDHTDNASIQFEIQTSDDGKIYTPVYSGSSIPSTEENAWELHRFNSKTNCKTIRFIAKGSNISNISRVKEIRFIR